MCCGWCVMWCGVQNAIRQRGVRGLSILCTAFFLHKFSCVVRRVVWDVALFSGYKHCSLLFAEVCNPHGTQQNKNTSCGLARQGANLRKGRECNVQQNQKTKKKRPMGKINKRAWYGTANFRTRASKIQYAPSVGSSTKLDGTRLHLQQANKIKNIPRAGSMMNLEHNQRQKNRERNEMLCGRRRGRTLKGGLRVRR